LLRVSRGRTGWRLFGRRFGTGEGSFRHIMRERRLLLPSEKE
jgi:hypothetical protein